jgi:hypothetical protein
VAGLRLYRDFYCISIEGSTTPPSYNLIDVDSLNVEIRNRVNNDLVETPSITRESLGVYYVEINQYLYDLENIYEVNWIVKYNSVSPIKKLLTRFKLYPTLIGNEVEIRLLDNDIEIRLDNDDIELRNDRGLEVRLDNDNYRLEDNSDGIRLEI